jgi:hypothetical protein
MGRTRKCVPPTERIVERRGNLIAVDFGVEGDHQPPTPRFPGAPGLRVPFNGDSHAEAILPVTVSAGS